jgi:hypothetical protein
VLPAGVALKGAGPGMTRLLQYYTANTFIRSVGSLGTAVALTVDATPPNTITLTMTSTSGLAAGDTLMLRSEAVAYSATGTGKRGEYRRIRSVDSATVVTLWAPPRDNYLVSDTASVQKVTFNKGNGISDLTVVNPTPNSNQQNAVEFAICLDPHVSNVQFESIDSAGVLLTGTFGGDVDGCKFTDQPDRVNFATPEFGYGIDARNATENLTVRGIVGRRLRHLFTTTTHHSGTSTVYGIPRAITVQGIATEMLGPAFDTHPAAEDVIFSGCVVNGCTHTGYNLRGQNNKVMGS